MNLDGSNLVQLTFGIADCFPNITPDSRWVIYIAPFEAKPTLWKVSIDGGVPVRIMDHVATMGVPSPDGKLIAYTYPESYDPTAPPNRLAIMTADGNTNIKTFEVARAAAHVLSDDAVVTTTANQLFTRLLPTTSPISGVSRLTVDQRSKSPISKRC